MNYYRERLPRAYRVQYERNLAEPRAHAGAWVIFSVLLGAFTVAGIALAFILSILLN